MSGRNKRKKAGHDFPAAARNLRYRAPTEREKEERFLRSGTAEGADPPVEMTGDGGEVAARTVRGHGV
jgi:hypothetical protein